MTEVGLVLAVKGLSSVVALFCPTPAQTKHITSAEHVLQVPKYNPQTYTLLSPTSGHL